MNIFCQDNSPSVMSWKERNSFNSKRSLSEVDGTPAEVFEFKIVMVGTMGVGKTSLAARYVKDTYRDFVSSTIGASYLWRKERIDDKDVKFSIWDTAGQEQFYALVPMYFRDAEAVILVVDVTRDTCEEEVMLWLDKVKQSAPASALVFLALNKTDMADQRVYPLSSAQQLAKGAPSSFRMECAEVSAKTGDGVRELFERIGVACLSKHSSVAPGGEKGGKGDSVRLASPKRDRGGKSNGSDGDSKCKC